MNKICLIKIELKKITQYIENVKLNSILLFLSIGIQLSIFHMFFYNDTGDKLWGQTIVYTMLAGSMYSVISINRVPEFAESIKNGKVVRYLIRPIGIFEQTILQEIGNSIMEVIQAIPALVITFMISTILFSNLERLPLYIISVILSIILSILIGNTFFCFTFLTLNYSSMKAIIQGINGLLSGTLIPLILWPDKLSSLVKYSPFAVLIDGPIKIYLEIDEFRNIIGYQLLWCIIFYLIGKFLFNKLPKYCDYVGG